MQVINIIQTMQKFDLYVSDKPPQYSNLQNVNVLTKKSIAINNPLINLVKGIPDCTLYEL